MDVQLAKNTPMLCRVKRNTQQSLNQGRKIPTHGRKDKSVNFKFTYDCAKLFKSGAYLYTFEVKNMSRRDPKVGSSTKERFIYFDLMIWKDARETERSDNLFETRAKLLDPYRDFQRRDSAIGKP